MRSSLWGQERQEKHLIMVPGLWVPEKALFPRRLKAAMLVSDYAKPRQHLEVNHCFLVKILALPVALLVEFPRGKWGHG